MVLVICFFFFLSLGLVFNVELFEYSSRAGQGQGQIIREGLENPDEDSLLKFEA